ncbi:hypothetical protein Q670_13070 [Alcanivorax sp. P2S70]|nr:hypothetical protein Q670_13070 [Alcanivorax sp. P2S70]
MTTRQHHAFFHDHGIAKRACSVMHEMDSMGASHTWCFVIMPDHCHWMLTLKGNASLSQTVRMFKGKSSRLAGLSLWQRGFHERALRRDEDLLPTARYVIANPLRIGLVSRLGDYPYWDAVWL